jgi:hypothetical protein
MGSVRQQPKKSDLMVSLLLVCCAVCTRLTSSVLRATRSSIESQDPAPKGCCGAAQQLGWMSGCAVRKRSGYDSPPCIFFSRDEALLKRTSDVLPPISVTRPFRLYIQVVRWAITGVPKSLSSRLKQLQTEDEQLQSLKSRSWSSVYAGATDPIPSIVYKLTSCSVQQ